MTELQVWVALIGVLVLAAGWLIFVAFLRYKAMLMAREPRKVQIMDTRTGAMLEGTGDNPDWKEAEKEAMLRAARNIRRQAAGGEDALFS